jgi:hypothetical protein
MQYILVGSTCEPTLARRLSGHVASYKRFLLGKGNYITSFKILENEDYDIVLMADVPCERKDQLHYIESHYIKNNNCVNKIVPKRTRQQHYKDNKKKINKLQSQKHKCSCGGLFTTTNRSHHILSDKHQQYINNKIEAQYKYCVELFESTQNLPFENQLVQF